ncbi:hypothetical protein AB3466_11805 [Sphingobacterium thalpophilum]|uniref:hypothetical protein n=1 Tax=Sphingobacterium thalpophilum TaxID=259 RepID=UPI0031D97055
MEIISVILSHLWSVIGIALTVYCYVVIRKSRFIVVNELQFNVINLPSSVEIKFDHVPVKANVKYYKLLICCSGVEDIKEEDITIPITIKNKDEDSLFHRVKILETSRTFNPKVKWHKNEIQITSPMIKVGDSVLIEFYLESNSNSPYFYQRMHNVEIKSKIHINETGLIANAVGFFICFIFVVYFINQQKIHYEHRHDYKDEYNIQYNYRGYEIIEDHKFLSSRIADSLYQDNFIRNFQLSNRNLDSLARDGNLEHKIAIINGNLHELNRYNFFEDSIMRRKPSILADSLLVQFTRQDGIPFSQEVKVNNDLKIRFTNPREETWSNVLFDVFFLFLSLFFLLFSLFRSAKYAIQYWSIHKAHQYLKK